MTPAENMWQEMKVALIEEWLKTKHNFRHGGSTTGQLKYMDASRCYKTIMNLISIQENKDKSFMDRWDALLDITEEKVTNSKIQAKKHGDKSSLIKYKEYNKILQLMIVKYNR